MNSSLSTNDNKGEKTPFFTRLSNLIILQVFFLFAAFALLFMYPVKERINTDNPIQLEEKFSAIIEQLSDCNNTNEYGLCADRLEAVFKSSFSHLDYIRSNIYISDEKENILSIFNSVKDNDTEIESEPFDISFIGTELLKSDNHLVQSIPSTHNIVYYYTFDLNPNQKALLAAEFEHHYFVTSKDKVMYVFGLLFLGGILISLLTVYLINKRIREPLARIMKGLEKTTEGDLYYMVETDKDFEMNKLTDSFNRMSRTLWENDQKLKKYNQNLINANSNLLNSREFLRKILDNSTSSIITTNLDGIIEVFNETAGEQFELLAEQAIGTDINHLFTNDSSLNLLDSQPSEEVEVVCKKSDGTVFPAFLLSAPIYDSENKITSLLYVIRDITESKTIHNMMIQMDRYYAKGEMAGDIAHEINNFLAILSGNIELMPLLLKKNDPDKIKSKLELMKKQVDRIVNFTDGLLEANDGDDSFVQVDMNQLLEAVKAFLQPQNLFDYINIDIKHAENIPLVHTNIGQIRQLFVNLIYNAGEALSSLEGEKIVQVRSELTGTEENQTISITVQDNGPGVAKENIDYLFKKRFTTKPHGHGISLVACQKIIDTHSGSIAYKYNNGALFTVVLPIRQEIEEQNGSQPNDSHALYS